MWRQPNGFGGWLGGMAGVDGWGGQGVTTEYTEYTEVDGWGWLLGLVEGNHEIREILEPWVELFSLGKIE